MRTLTLVFIGLIACLQCGSVLAQKTGLVPTHLTAGMQIDPLGVDTSHLTFAWSLTAAHAADRGLSQNGYRIRLAKSVSDLADSTKDIWDSGIVTSKTYWQLKYTGPALRSASSYYWQAQVSNSKGVRGPWSAPARFTTGLLKSTDWTAHWIAATPDTEDAAKNSGTHPLPVFRREIQVKANVASALLFVTGMGQYEVHLNGKNVTDTVLNPAWSDYRKTVFYDSYDVRQLLRPGANAFGILLGNGMYNVEETKGRYTKFTGSFGQPKCLLQLEVRYTDGSSERFVSDSSWTTHPGPIAFSSTYGGEDFNAGALPEGWDLPGFQGSGWKPALAVSGPGGAVKTDESTPLVVGQQYKSVRVTQPKPGVLVYDLGENMSGWPEIMVRGAAGAKVRLLCGELLAGDGTVTQRSAAATPNDPVLFDYTLRGSAAGERWHPRFSYYSFRYVQITTEPATPDEAQPKVLSLVGDFVHAGVADAGHFESSDRLFNRIHTLIDRAVLSNLASVLTDCPSREKLGWLEQTYLNASTLMLNYDVTRTYEKMSGDMADAQLADGLVPSIAPEYVQFVDGSAKNTPFRDSPEWGSAVILSPWALYQFTGDAQPLLEHYAGMQRYVAYLGARAKGNLLDYGLGDWYDIGPKPPGESQLTSKTVTATGTYYEDLIALAQIATLLAHPADAEGYTRKASAVRDAFNAKLFDPATNQYDRGSQTANAVPLALGMVPAGHEQPVLDHLVADIHAHTDHVTAGDVGFHYVVRALTEYGRSDVLAAMLSRTDSPSYGYQLAHGATTLTEAWDANPESSQNHFMLGHGEEWFYRGLAGLSIDMARGPEDAVVFRPSLLSSVDSASADYESPLGRLSIAWHRSGNTAVVSVTIPPGAQARLLLPAAAWREGAVSASQTPGILRWIKDAHGLQLQLGSGTYRFSTHVLSQ